MTHEEIAAQVAENRAMMEEMDSRLTRLCEDSAKTLEIVEAWSAVKTGGKFVKWVSGLIAALLVVWAALRGGAQLFMEIGGK